MPLKTEFLYDISKSPAFELTYFICAASCFLRVFMSVRWFEFCRSFQAFFGFQVGVDTFFFSCCLNISTHFDILRESFDGDKKKFVEKHLELLNLVKDLNELFNEVVFCQFLLSSLQLCVLGFQVVIVESIAGLIVPAVYGLTIIIQLFVYSFGGQLIVNSSDAISENLYEVDRDLILMIARPQKSTMIKSVFFTADLPSFLSIMRFTGSLITMLKSFVK
jgi:hypothetical protein